MSTPIIYCDQEEMEIILLKMVIAECWEGFDFDSKGESAEGVEMNLKSTLGIKLKAAYQTFMDMFNFMK